MNVKKVILATIVIWIVGFLFAWFTCGWLFNWVYQIPPIIWHGPETMMSTGNMIWSNLIGIIRALLFVLVYIVFSKALAGQGAVRGMQYGFFIWLVGALYGMASMPFYMTIATTVVIYWIIQALVLNLIMGALVGAIYK